MAKTVVTTDDLDGSAGAETVAFSFAGASYEIDLTKKNAAAMQKALKPYLDVARTVSGRSGGRRAAGGGTRGRGTSKPTDLRAIRAWASENGYEVSTRGRIAAEIVEAYHAAQR